MPISLTKADTVSAVTAEALRSVIKDLPAEHNLTVALEHWLQSPAGKEMTLAWFNDRIVAFALLEGSQLLALAVHPATRRRGIARRMISLLQADDPSSQFAFHGDCDILSKLIAESREIPG